MKSGARGTGSASTHKGKQGKITKKVCSLSSLQHRNAISSIFPFVILRLRFSTPQPFFIRLVEELTKRIGNQFVINASQPASDKIFDVSAFEKFLHDKIKVDNRVGNLGDAVQISQIGDGKIEVIAHTKFSGRYIKYLYVFKYCPRSLVCLE